GCRRPRSPSPTSSTAACSCPGCPKGSWARTVPGWSGRCWSPGCGRPPPPAPASPKTSAPTPWWYWARHTTTCICPPGSTTLPPPQRQPGRAEQLRQAARRHTGLSQRVRRRLLADALTQPAVEPGDSENNVEDNPVPTNLVGINTFPPTNPPSSRAGRGERP